MANDFEELLAALTPAPIDREQACTNGRTGTRKWGFGTLTCTVEEGTASIIWTDRRSQLLGRLDGPTDDLQDVFAWWQENARALGRPIDTGPEASPDSTTGGAARFVAVPGDPISISCEAVGEPIADEYGRIWSVDAVDFQERGDFERVIIQLDRVGTERNARNTQVVAERLPVSGLGRAVASAPTPQAGKTAIVVDLKGIRQAPDIRRFRPTATDLVKEFSLVPDGKSRAAVISTPKGTCYQVRVPVFGRSATGKERQAAVYIDLR